MSCHCCGFLCFLVVFSVPLSCYRAAFCSLTWYIYLVYLSCLFFTFTHLKSLLLGFSFCLSLSSLFVFMSLFVSCRCLFPVLKCFAFVPFPLQNCVFSVPLIIQHFVVFKQGIFSVMVIHLYIPRYSIFILSTVSCFAYDQSLSLAICLFKELQTVLTSSFVLKMYMCRL